MLTLYFAFCHRVYLLCPYRLPSLSLLEPPISVPRSQSLHNAPGPLSPEGLNAFSWFLWVSLSVLVRTDFPPLPALSFLPLDSWLTQ